MAGWTPETGCFQTDQENFAHAVNPTNISQTSLCRSRTRLVLPRNYSLIILFLCFLPMFNSLFIFRFFSFYSYLRVVFTFAPCMLLHLFYLKPTHAIL